MTTIENITSPQIGDLIVIEEKGSYIFGIVISIAYSPLEYLVFWSDKDAGVWHSPRATESYLREFEAIKCLLNL